MTSREAIEHLKNDCNPTQTDAIATIEKDLELLDKYKNALNEIVAKKPITNSDFKPIASGDSINDIIRSITDYIIALSNIDNIIISAVYEKFYKKHKNDLEVLDILLNDIDHLICKVDEENRRYIDFGGKYPIWYEYDNNDDEFDIIWDWLQQRRKRK